MQWKGSKKRPNKQVRPYDRKRKTAASVIRELVDRTMQGDSVYNRMRDCQKRDATIDVARQICIRQQELMRAKMDLILGGERGE